MMSEAIETHCETALESPYSRDREQAIEELAQLVSEVGLDERRQIVETLRQVAHKATATTERELAREAMIDAFDHDPETVGPIVIPCFCDIAAAGTHREDQLDALDALRTLHSEVDESLQEEIGEQLAELAGDATYEDLRRRARQRLSDITAENNRTSSSPQRTEANKEQSHAGYLATSLAEHLITATKDSPEACRQRAEELHEFVVNTPADDAQYEDVRDDLAGLIEQLAVVPMDDELGPERQKRVERLANRVQRLYTRPE